MQRMIEAYLAERTPESEWFVGPWRRPEDRARYARSLAERWDRAALVGILETALDERSAPAATRANARRLGTAGTVAVVSGQQPAIGGGPLYTLVKAAHSIAVAAELEAAGVPAVPVFWCASEDHDLGEAGHADLVARDGRIARIHARLPRHGASLRFQPATAGWDHLLTGLAQLEGSLGALWWRAQAPRADESLGGWCARLLETVFADHALVVVEAHHLRPLTVPGVARALDAWPGAALTRRNAELEAAGHPLPLGELASPPLFADRPSGRRALDLDAAWHLLAEDPTALSPGAGLRPVLQQLALPAAVYCAGPGEIAYHAQLGPLYTALDAQPPLLLPRVSMSIIPPWFERACDAWHTSPEQLLAGLPTTDSVAVEDHLAGLDTALRELEHRVRGLDQDTARRLTTGHHRLLRERDRIAASLERGRRRHENRPSPGALREWLLPRGGRQERTMSLAQALWEHGPGLATELVAQSATAALGEHHLVVLA